MTLDEKQIQAERLACSEARRALFIAYKHLIALKGIAEARGDRPRVILCGIAAKYVQGAADIVAPSNDPG